MDDKENSVKKNLFKLNKKIAIGLASVVVLIIVAGAVYASSVNSKINNWQDKIYPGIKIDNVDISGKTKEEAVEILNKDLGDKVKNKKINIAVNDKNFTLKFSDLSPKVNIEETVNKAMELGKDSSFFNKKAWIDGRHNEDLSLDVSLDESKIEPFKESIRGVVNHSAKNASISINSGKISITKENDGIKIKEEDFTDKLKNAIEEKSPEDSNITITTEVDKPTITEEILSKIDSKISHAETNYASSNYGRATNVELATKHCNGVLLMPGQEFSYNQSVGERTAARGFKDAAVFVGDKVEQGLGGGICQVSTALYRAAIEANLRSTERHNHSMLPSYSVPGLDATVVWGVLDYKFKNTYDFPIYIESYTSNRIVTINIYGNKAGMNGKTYKFIAQTTDTLHPDNSTKEDKNLTPAESKWEKHPVVGYKAKSYLITYENGKEVNREVITSDTYAKVNGVMLKGTKSVGAPKTQDVHTNAEVKDKTPSAEEKNHQSTTQPNEQTSATNNQSNSSTDEHKQNQ